jgi:hypothetical protein
LLFVVNVNVGPHETLWKRVWVFSNISNSFSSVNWLVILVWVDNLGSLWNWLCFPKLVSVIKWSKLLDLLLSFLMLNVLSVKSLKQLTDLSLGLLLVLKGLLNKGLLLISDLNVLQLVFDILILVDSLVNFH